MISFLGCSGESKISTNELPTKFLNSTIITPFGMNSFPYGEFTVKDFVGYVKNMEFDNGKTPVVHGWTKMDNIYTYYVDMIHGRKMKFIFSHILSTKKGNGKYSSMYANFEGEDMQGFAALKAVLENQRAK
jgi:hypothetical protein